MLLERRGRVGQEGYRPRLRAGTPRPREPPSLRRRTWEGLGRLQPEGGNRSRVSRGGRKPQPREPFILSLGATFLLFGDSKPISKAGVPRTSRQEAASPARGASGRSGGRTSKQQQGWAEAARLSGAGQVGSSGSGDPVLGSAPGPFAASYTLPLPCGLLRTTRRFTRRSGDLIKPAGAARSRRRRGGSSGSDSGTTPQRPRRGPDASCAQGSGGR